ncbi:MAG: quinolinate synthase NadA [Planctomycetota bacterium]|jgi:quinolinate synthase
MTADLLNEKVEKLKKDRSAVVLVHNYAPGEVQDVGDFVGDSLGLSREAAETDADCIIFCGVHFMAETAAILSPEKKVYMPDVNAGCPMANMVTERQLQEMKDKHPGALVVTYVNSSAAIKAMSDICCTSANAVNVVKNLPPDKEIIFVPDRNLGHYVSKVLGREMILWNGFCPTHERIMPEHVQQTRERHPAAVFVAHPECRPAVVDMADEVGSTTGILKFCRETSEKEVIVGTELGILHRVRNENPAKIFYEASPISDCPNMKLNSLEKLVWCLEELTGEVTVSDDIAEKARSPIEKMLEVTGG